MQKILHQILAHAGAGRQQLAVGRGHGGGQNARQDQTGHDAEQNAVLADQMRDLHNDGFAFAAAGKQGHKAGLGHGVANNADQHRHGHGDHHPHAGDTAAQLELVFIFNGHKAQQNMGHAKIAKAPCQRGDHRNKAIRLGSAIGHAVRGGHAQIARHRAGVLHHGLHAARSIHAVDHHHQQGKGHHNRLHKIGGGNCHKAAQNSVH